MAEPRPLWVSSRTGGAVAACITDNCRRGTERPLCSLGSGAAKPEESVEGHHVLAREDRYASAVLHNGKG